MAGKIQANQNNDVVLYATLPEDDRTSSVIIDMEGHYDEFHHSDIFRVEQKGGWVSGELTADKVPPTDDFYDVKVYAGSDGNISWEHEERNWDEILETWEAIEGIVRGILIANSTFEVVGNEDNTSKEYISENQDFNQEEYISDQEQYSGEEYISNSDGFNREEYISDSENVSENQYISDNEDPRSKSYR